MAGGFLLCYCFLSPPPDFSQADFINVQLYKGHQKPGHTTLGDWHLANMVEPLPRGNWHKRPPGERPGDIQDWNMGANEMAQWVGVLPAKPGNLSLISRTYMVEQENQLQVKL